MIKIIGIVLILFSTIIYGFKLSNDIKSRIKELYEIKKIMFLLKGEIEYSINPIRDAFINISERVSNIFEKILIGISQNNEGRLCDIWTSEWQEGFKNLHISEEEKNEILDLRDCFGMVDKDVQVKQIELYLLRLNDSISNLQSVIPQKCRLYKCLSIGFGIFMSIIII